MFNCPSCGSKMIWQSDWDFEDVGREGEGVESFHICSNSKCKSEFHHIMKNSIDEEGGE